MLRTAMIFLLFATLPATAMAGERLSARAVPSGCLPGASPDTWFLAVPNRQRTHALVLGRRVGAPMPPSRPCDASWRELAIATPTAETAVGSGTDEADDAIYSIPPERRFTWSNDGSFIPIGRHFRDGSSPQLKFVDARTASFIEFKAGTISASSENFLGWHPARRHTALLKAPDGGPPLEALPIVFIEGRAEPLPDLAVVRSRRGRK